MQTKISTKREEKKARNREHKRLEYAKNPNKFIEQAKKWKAKNIERVKNNLRMWRKNNPEKTKEYRKHWITNNPKKYRECIQNWREKNRGKIRKQSIDWYYNHLERKKEYRREKREKDPDGIKEYHKNWKNNHREIVREYCRKRKMILCRTPRGALDIRMGALIRTTLRSVKNGRKWQSLVGYSIDKLKQHIESKFAKGMTWELFLKGEIHIDHIVPISFFQYDRPEDQEFKYCWSLDNLQPLWKNDNLKKSNKLIREYLSETTIAK